MNPPKGEWRVRASPNLITKIVHRRHNLHPHHSQKVQAAAPRTVEEAVNFTACARYCKGVSWGSRPSPAGAPDPSPSRPPPPPNSAARARGLLGRAQARPPHGEQPGHCAHSSNSRARAPGRAAGADSWIRPRPPPAPASPAHAPHTTARSMARMWERERERRERGGTGEKGRGGRERWGGERKQHSLSNWVEARFSAEHRCNPTRARARFPRRRPRGCARRP
jgi:hypothetical protein